MQINKTDFDVVTLEDEIRVDGLCKGLIMNFYEAQLDAGLDAAEATRLANGADYFIRDFVIGVKQLNIFTEYPALVRQFAGNWYIVNTIDPSIELLEDHLHGVAAFYRYLEGEGMVSALFLERIVAECAALSYYEQRIASFWDIEGDGYFAWERECPLRNSEGARNA